MTESTLTAKTKTASGFSTNAAIIFFIGSALAALFVLLSSTTFAVSTMAKIAALALLLNVPIGWVLVRLFAPNLQSTSARVALILSFGYVGSIYVGYFLGVLGLQFLYLPVSGLLLVGMLVGIYLDARRAETGSVRRALYARVSQIAASPTPWLVGGIGFLSIAAAAPLMAPLMQLPDNQYIDFAYIDAYFHIARASVLATGAPAFTAADLAGSLPVVYPDYVNFWVGQVANFSRTGIATTYFVYVPILTLLYYAFLNYALGRQLTKSPWGGLIAAALAYLVFVPNLYDRTWLQHDMVAAQELSNRVMHFVDLRGNLAYGLAWSIMSTLALVISLSEKEKKSGNSMRLLAGAALLVAMLIRVRSHFFMVVAPVFVLLCIWFIWRRRDWRYVIPIFALGIFFAPIWFESTGSHFENASTKLNLVYGVYGEFAINYLPLPLRSFFEQVPPPIRTITNTWGVIVLQYFGIFFGAIMVYWVVQMARRRMRPTTVDVFWAVVLIFASIAALFVVLDAFKNTVGGAWAAQVLNSVPRIALILAIVPLYHLLRNLTRRIDIVRSNMTALAFVLLLLATVVTYQSAKAEVHNQPDRAYPITGQELRAYNWIKNNTPRRASVAAYPAHVVNPAGETIVDTNFLSGMTERPAYVQRVEVYNVPEAKRRIELLNRIFDAPTQDALRDALQQAKFDYLLVYPDKPLHIDPSCCMEAVYKGTPSVYRLTKP